MTRKADRTAWRALPYRVRRGVRRDGRAGSAASTPELRRLAFAWATRRSPGWPWWFLFALFVVLAVVTPVLVHFNLLVDNRFARTLWIPVLALGGILAYQFQRTAALVAAANALPPLDGSQPESLEVRATPASDALYPACSVVVLATIYVVQGPRGGWSTNTDIAVMLATFILMTVLLNYVSPGWLWRQPRKGKPVILLDADGIGLPRLGVRMPWTDVADVRTRPTPAERGATPGIAFAVADPGAVLAAAKPPSFAARRQLSRMLRKDGVLSVPAHWLDRPLPTVLATARSYLASTPSAGDHG
jgi:hypothetical protein